MTLAKKRLQHYRFGHRNNPDVAKLRTREIVIGMDLFGEFAEQALADIADENQHNDNLDCPD